MDVDENEDVDVERDAERAVDGGGGRGGGVDNCCPCRDMGEPGTPGGSVDPADALNSAAVASLSFS